MADTRLETHSILWQSCDQDQTGQETSEESVEHEHVVVDGRVVRVSKGLCTWRVSVRRALRIVAACG